MRETKFLARGEFAKLDLFLMSYLSKFSKNGHYGKDKLDSERISLAQEYVTKLALEEKEDAGLEYRTRTAAQIINSGKYANPIEQSLVFCAVARTLGIAVKYTEYINLRSLEVISQQDNTWIENINPPVDALVSLEVEVNGTWKPYDVSKGIFVEDSSALVGREVIHDGKTYLHVGEGLDFGALYPAYSENFPDDSEMPIRLQSARDFLTYARKEFRVEEPISKDLVVDDSHSDLPSQTTELIPVNPDITEAHPAGNVIITASARDNGIVQSSDAQSKYRRKNGNPDQSTLPLFD